MQLPCTCTTPINNLCYLFIGAIKCPQVTRQGCISYILIRAVKPVQRLRPALSNSSCSVHVCCTLSRNLPDWTTLLCFARTGNMGKFRLGRFFSCVYNIKRQFLESVFFFKIQTSKSQSLGMSPVYI